MSLRLKLIKSWQDTSATRGGAALAGNVATEDVVYLLNGLGIKHGVDMEKLLDVSQFISDALGRPNSSRAAKALLAARADAPPS